MGYVYRYTDLKDNQIKYVGIVYGNTRTLTRRVYEHKLYDEWCKNGNYKIEYIKMPIHTRTDAEFLESHFISLYKTDRFYNIKKKGWGVSKLISEQEFKWELYKGDEERVYETVYELRILNGVAEMREHLLYKNKNGQLKGKGEGNTNFSLYHFENFENFNTSYFTVYSTDLKKISDFWDSKKSICNAYLSEEIEKYHKKCMSLSEKIKKQKNQLNIIKAHVK